MTLARIKINVGQNVYSHKVKRIIFSEQLMCLLCPKLDGFVVGGDVYCQQNPVLTWVEQFSSFWNESWSWVRSLYQTGRSSSWTHDPVAEIPLHGCGLLSAPSSPSMKAVNRCLQTVHQLGTQYDSSSENTDRVDRRGSRWRSSEAPFTRQSWNLTQSSVECPERWTSYIITSLVIWKQICIMSTHSFNFTNIYKQYKSWIDLAADIQQNLANLENISCNLF